MDKPVDKPTVIESDTMILPTGMTPEMSRSYRHYVIHVRWLDGGEWAVSGLMNDTCLSVEGRTWSERIPRKDQHLYRFPSRESAMFAAIEEADRQTIGGKTFRQAHHRWLQDQENPT